MLNHTVRILASKKLAGDFFSQLPEGQISIIEITPSIEVGPALELITGPSGHYRSSASLRFAFSTENASYLSTSVRGGDEHTVDELCARLLIVLKNPSTILEYSETPLIPIPQER